MSRNYKIWDDTNGKRLLLIAMSLVLVIHGVIVYYTLPKTYDAYVHMFFADHYARFWFEPWEYRWYTGFLTVSYPPLVHQLVALLGKIFPLKVAFSLYAIVIYEVLIIGVYRFSKIFFDKTTAGIAAILAVVLSSLVETLHVYGQVPTLTGISFLLNSLPFLYQYIVKRKTIYLVMGLAFLSVVISSHHVTAIFGMVFFIAPVFFMALVDGLPPESRPRNFILFFGQVVLAALRQIKQIILFGGLMIVLAIGLIFPYWYWSRSDPITQVPIPHGSRDNFIAEFSSGLVFYIIPLTLILALIPAITYLITRERRHFGWVVSFYLCLLLGSGGTTPLPKMMLGDTAFNILTLDRFGFWASIIAIPFMAKFIHTFLAGSVRDFWVRRFGERGHFTLSALSGFTYLLFIVFIFHLAAFRPLQPKPVEIQPILNFLNRDDHMRWRYMTLGFGDQMAWLSANSLAATVDGNYHSARRLPELTSRPVERLENAKFLGYEGLASLNDFLTKAEKYSLKYIFSNDQYYDPLLFYTGWNRTIQLENGIMVWEKGNISTIKPVVPTEIHPVLKYTWGIFPLASLVLAFLLTYIYLKKYKEREYRGTANMPPDSYPRAVMYSASFLPVLFFSAFISFQIYELLLVKKQKNPKTTIENYYNHLDFQRFEAAFHFFQPKPTFTLDQYLLEKSVSDGGLLPSYAKLDSIHVTEIKRQEDSCLVEVFTEWNTSLGPRQKRERMELINQDSRWYIIPPEFQAEIPEEQMRSYTFTLFKKQGKRVISSFPTVKDDRVKKPFAACKQVNLIRDDNRYFLTGELINADDIPVNMALKAVVQYANGQAKNFFPTTAFQYNLAPKGSSFFQIDLDSIGRLDSLPIESINLLVETDVSERGYIHGGTLAYQVKNQTGPSKKITINYYDELPVDINIPGVLIAEKDENGIIWQTKLHLHPKALRSGLHMSFETDFEMIQQRGQRISDVPIEVSINGTNRKILPLQKDELAIEHQGLVLLPHCFISQVIYLQ